MEGDQTHRQRASAHRPRLDRADRRRRTTGCHACDRAQSRPCFPVGTRLPHHWLPTPLGAAGREGPRGAGQSPGSGSTCAIPTRARGPARTKRRCGSLPSGWLLWNETIGPKQHARSRCCLSNAIIGEPTRETESTLGGAQVAPPPGADVLLRFPMRGAARRGGDPDRPEGAIVPPISIRLSLSSHVRRASTAIALATEKSSG